MNEQAFDYSDGDDFESRLVDTLQRATNLGSGAQIEPDWQAQSWPARYHLSPDRANLLRHLELSGLDVLELGAGFGGVSRVLAEGSRWLTAVEGSTVRATGLRARLRDLTNCQVRVGRIETITLDRTFDLVCAVGSLEYAEVYCQVPAGYPGDAFDFFLDRAVSFLGQDGVLVLAIENRLGIKYWTGAPDDHSGVLFAGPAGFPASPSARTFSRRELGERLQRCGLVAAHWQFPFPDYKLPRSVLTEALVLEDPRLAVDLACASPFDTPPYPRSQLLPDYLALDGLARAGLFADFANSFLVLAARNESSATLGELTAKQTTRAWHVSPRRRSVVDTVFSRCPTGLVVSKQLRAGGASSSRVFREDDVTYFWRDEGEQPVAVGQFLRLRMLRQLFFGEEQAFLSELREFLRWLLATLGHGKGHLTPNAVDARVSNAVSTGPGSYQLFDLEWQADRPIPASWLVIRNLLLWLPEAHLLAKLPSLTTLADLYQAMVNDLGLGADLSGDLEREAQLQRMVATRGPSAADLAKVFGQPLRLFEPSPV